MSCLFNSLSKFVNMSPEQLRSSICNYIKNNNNLFDDVKMEEVISWETNMKFNDYVDMMEKKSTWGGAIEIKSFCEMFNIVVIVILNDRKIEFIPSSKCTDKVIYLNYTGNHYF